MIVFPKIFAAFLAVTSVALGSSTAARARPPPEPRGTRPRALHGNLYRPLLRRNLPRHATHPAAI
jgi:hypothetical protein